MDLLQPLLTLSIELQLPLSLEDLLSRVVGRAGQLLGTQRASIRLFDASRTRLFLGARLGEPVHEIPWEQQPGEGLLGWVAREGKPLLTGDAEADPRYLPRAGMRAPLRSFLGMPIIYQGLCVGVLSAVHEDKDRFARSQLDLAQLIAALCAPHLEVARIARLARLDPLTGTLRPERLAELLPGVSKASVVLLDVDGMTSLNSQGGRDLGDEVLRTIARVLAAALRVGDAVVRYGDDAFVLVIDGVGQLSASRVAERVRAAIAGAEISVPGHQARATVSIGVAERRPGEGQGELMQRAQAALDEARKRGDSVSLAR